MWVAEGLVWAFKFFFFFSLQSNSSIFLLPPFFQDEFCVCVCVCFPDEKQWTHMKTKPGAVQSCRGSTGSMKSLHWSWTIILLRWLVKSKERELFQSHELLESDRRLAAVVLGISWALALLGCPVPQLTDQMDDCLGPFNEALFTPAFVQGYRGEGHPRKTM